MLGYLNIALHTNIILLYFRLGLLCIACPGMQEEIK